jgi:pimeloyl-ACP methyl ester carboxylesterase
VTAPLPIPDASPVAHWTTIDWSNHVDNRLVNGLRLRYVDYGSGPVLVLMHGMAASWQWWLENIPALAQQHRVIAVDLPGCGNSERLPAPAEMATHAHTVLGLLEQLGVESATVAGHSMGGLVALEMAKADPQRVKDLILVDAGGAPMSERRLAIILVVLRVAAAILRRSVVRHALATKPWVRNLAMRGGFRDPRVISAALAAEIMPVFGGPGFVDSVAAAGRAVRAMVTDTISCPVLLLWGDHDVMAPLDGARDLHRDLAQSELVVVAGAGHSPMIEFPDQFNDAVLQFTAGTR